MHIPAYVFVRAIALVWVLWEWLDIIVCKLSNSIWVGWVDGGFDCSHPYPFVFYCFVVNLVMPYYIVVSFFSMNI